jgi:hypothetical protein
VREIMAEAPFVTFSVPSCSSLSEREIVVVDNSVAPCVDDCMSRTEREREVVALSVASLMRRAIDSLLSIMVCVKVTPLVSIAFTACSVTRLTSSANSWLLPLSAMISELDFSSRRRVISAER